MTNEEAIKRVKNSCYLTKALTMNDAIKDNIAINMAIKALEKQVPKKPEQDGHGYYCSCGNFIIWDDEEPNASDTYCGQCGQKQDLSEV